MTLTERYLAWLDAHDERQQAHGEALRMEAVRADIELFWQQADEQDPLLELSSDLGLEYEDESD